MEIQFHVEKGRVLVPVGVPCPFGCGYCYTRGGEVGPPREELEVILQRFQAFTLIHNNNFSTIQLGYDGDPFADPERGLILLHGLCAFGKHINISTKALIEGEVLAGFAEVRKHLAPHLVLSALVSLSCGESASVVEPHTPTPEERMWTVRNLKQIGVPSLIAVRPIIPHIADVEYEWLFDEALKAGAIGVILGPYYVDEKERFIRFMSTSQKKTLQMLPASKGRVRWSPHHPEWSRYEDEERTQRLASMARKKGALVFESSANAVDHINRKGLLVAQPTSSDPQPLEDGFTLYRGPDGLQAFSNSHELRKP